MTNYDEDYFLRGNEIGKSLYTDYKWLCLPTMKMALTLIEQFDLHDKTVIDYGCARGYLVKALRRFDVNAIGVDVSEWALSNCDSEISDSVGHIEDHDRVCDFGICKDVLEHIDEKDMPSVFSFMEKFAKEWFLVIPVGDNGKFYIDNYNLDPSHVNIKPITGWVYSIIDYFDIEYISSTPVAGIKDKWQKINPGGDAFIHFKIKS